MKNYEAPELLSVGGVDEVVLGDKVQNNMDDQGNSFPHSSVLDVD